MVDQSTELTNSFLCTWITFVCLISSCCQHSPNVFLDTARSTRWFLVYECMIFILLYLTPIPSDYADVRGAACEKIVLMGYWLAQHQQRTFQDGYHCQDCEQSCLLQFQNAVYSKSSVQKLYGSVCCKELLFGKAPI